MNEKITIREARTDDRVAILAFTQDTFHWGDYVPQAWDEWLGAPNGRLIVAEVNGRPVGILHITYLGNREAWFEGMRVHPEFRQRGIAARLDSTARGLAYAAGCQIVRLETASDNFRAQAAVRRFGYRLVLSFRGWETRTIKGEAGRHRDARMTDLNYLMRLWEHSGMRRATRLLSPLADVWHWGKFTRKRLREEITLGRVWVTPPQGSARGFTMVRQDQEEFSAVLVVGRAREVRDLLHDLRVTAREQMVQGSP